MAEVVRYVNTASGGGDGTTNGEGTGGTAAYASLSAWEAAEQTDLVTAGDTHTVYCSTGSGTAADTTACTISGWTTGASNGITIIGNASTSDKASNQYDANKYRRTSTTVSGVNYVTWDGIQFHYETTNLATRRVLDCSNRSFTVVKNCWFFIKGSILSSADISAIRFSAGDGNVVVNNIIYFENTGVVSDGDEIYGIYAVDISRIGAGDLVLYNNTVYCTGMRSHDSRSAGIYGWAATSYPDTVILRNNLLYVTDGGGANTVEAFVPNVNPPDADYNASNDASADDAGGSNNRINQTFTFVNASNYDLQITSGDTGAKGYGVDLSSDTYYPFSTDINGDTRSTWDIGATTVAAASAIEGTASFSLPALTVSAEGDVPRTGEASLSLPALTASAVGENPLRGTASVTLPALWGHHTPAVTNLQYTTLTGNRVVLTWDAVDGAVYDIAYSVGSTFANGQRSFEDLSWDTFPTDYWDRQFDYMAIIDTDSNDKAYNQAARMFLALAVTETSFDTASFTYSKHLLGAQNSTAFALIPEQEYTFRVFSRRPEAGLQRSFTDITFTTPATANSYDEVTVTPADSAVAALDLIHGIVYHDGYIYCTSRQDNLVARYDVTDYTSYSTASYTMDDAAEPDDGLTYGKSEDLRVIGSKLYAMMADSTNTYIRLFEIDPATFTLSPLSMVFAETNQDAAATDGTYLFVQANNNVYRYDPGTDTYITFDDVNQFGGSSGGRGFHSLHADSTHLYGADSSIHAANALTSTPVSVAKWLISDGSLVDTADIPQCTDDSDGNASYYFLGNEDVLSSRAFGGTVNKVSTIAVRKSDLAQFQLPALPGWEQDTWSYAVYIYDTWLLNLCTNGKLYILDASDPSSWSISMDPAEVTLAVVDWSGAPVSGPANEFAIDEYGNLHVSMWDEPSGLVRFTIDGYDVTPVPTVTTDAPTVTSGAATLNGTVDTKGASNLTDWGYYYGTTNPPTTKQSAGGTPGIGAIDPWDWDPTPAGNLYFRSYATNGHGEAVGEVYGPFQALSYGVFAEDLPGLTLTAEGTVPVEGSANAYLPILALTADGYVPVRGTGTDQLPEITVTAEGTVLIEGVAVAVLPNLTASGYGTGPAELSGAVTLPVIDILEADGDLGPPPLDGIGFLTLPQLTAFGTAEDTQMQASGRFDLPILIGQGVGTNARSGLGAIAIPALQVSAAGKSEGFLVYVRHAGDEIVDLSGVTAVSATVVEGNSFLYEDKSCSVADATQGIIFVPAANGLTTDTTYRLQVRISWGSEFTFSFPSEGYTSFRLKTPES